MATSLCATTCAWRTSTTIGTICSATTTRYVFKKSAWLLRLELLLAENLVPVREYKDSVMGSTIGGRTLLVVDEGCVSAKVLTCKYMHSMAIF